MIRAELTKYVAREAVDIASEGHGPCSIYEDRRGYQWARLTAADPDSGWTRIATITCRLEEPTELAKAEGRDNA